jgi:hypothetical protein
MTDTRAMSRIRRPPDRDAGFSLIELGVTLATAVIIFGAAGTALSAIAESAKETSRVYGASDRLQFLRRSLATDLQMVDALHSDENDVPYVVPVENGAALEFRISRGVRPRVGGGFETNYSESIRYEPDGDRIVRTDATGSRVVGTHLRDVKFEVSPRGVITVSFELDFSFGGERVPRQFIHFVPRNSAF